MTITNAGIDRSCLETDLWLRPIDLWGVCTIQQTSSKLPANVFNIHVLMLDVCWKFAGTLLDRVNTLLVDRSNKPFSPVSI